jgi:hypothetical protein
MKEIKRILIVFTAILLVACGITTSGCSGAGESPRPVVLLTDFGSGDYRISQVKGIIYSHYPEALLVDASHDVPAFDIPTGAFMLEMAAKEFPQIHKPKQDISCLLPITTRFLSCPITVF